MENDKQRVLIESVWLCFGCIGAFVIATLILWCVLIISVAMMFIASGAPLDSEFPESVITLLLRVSIVVWISIGAYYWYLGRTKK